MTKQWECILVDKCYLTAKAERGLMRNVKCNGYIIKLLIKCLTSIFIFTGVESVCGVLGARWVWWMSPDGASGALGGGD
jgi:hypothetical protein